MLELDCNLSSSPAPLCSQPITPTLRPRASASRASTSAVSSPPGAVSPSHLPATLPSPVTVAATTRLAMPSRSARSSSNTTHLPSSASRSRPSLVRSRVARTSSSPSSSTLLAAVSRLLRTSSPCYSTTSSTRPATNKLLIGRVV